MRPVWGQAQSPRLRLVGHLSHKLRHGGKTPLGRLPDFARERVTGADLAETNVNGGAIAIGHPLGASAARIMTTLVNALHQRGGRHGLQTMCEGGAIANATIIERLG
jgi:hypothetical protein